MKNFVQGAALLAFLICCSAATAQSVAASKVALTLPHRTIAAERFQSTSAVKGPAIVVLHGAGGTLLDGPEMRRVARDLAAAGNDVYLVHYFETTGTLFALDATMQKNFSTWLQTVREAIVAVQAMHGGSEKIGIYGYSLGAFLALQSASDNPRVGAVVEHAGGVWNGEMQRLGRMPRVLMIHGEQDARVPFEKYAKPLLSLLQKRSAKVETRFFPGEGHVFTPAGWRKVHEIATEFFRRELHSAR